MSPDSAASENGAVKAEPNDVLEDVVNPDPVQEDDEDADGNSNAELNNQQKDTKDYSKIFEKYQERFNKVYETSQQLFVSERAQRETLNYYQRRNNALLELLNQLEDNENTVEIDDILNDNDKSRIENIIEMNPNLKTLLDPLLHLEKGNVQLKRSYKINLFLQESIPELVNDDIDLIESNPQSSDTWIRRNHPNLVISKYKPIDLKPSGIRETLEAPIPLTKKKRKISKDEK